MLLKAGILLANYTSGTSINQPLIQAEILCCEGAPSLLTCAKLMKEMDFKGRQVADGLLASGPDPAGVRVIDRPLSESCFEFTVKTMHVGLITLHF